MKFLYLLALLPGLALATGSNHHNDDVDIDVNTGDVITEVNTGDVVTEVNTGNVSTGDVSVEDGDVSLATSYENNAASSAYAYAAQCGTAGGVSVKEFSASVSGESQYCKHLRISSFYEALYLEAKSNKDNVMAQVWYDAMVREIVQSQALIDETRFTGRMKENAGDLLLPTLLCGGLSAAATPAAGYICLAGLVGKSAIDQKKADEKVQEKRDALYIRNTDHVSEVDCPPDTCAYVNGELHHYRD